MIRTQTHGRDGASSSTATSLSNEASCTAEEMYTSHSLSHLDDAPRSRGFGAVPSILRGSVDAILCDAAPLPERTTGVRPSGASVLPLFARAHLALGDARVVPLVLDGGCVGYVLEALAERLAAEKKHVRWAEHGRTRVLSLKNASTAALAKYVSAHCDGADRAPFLELPCASPMLTLGGGVMVERRAALVFGVRLHTASVVAYSVANAGGAASARYSVWLGRSMRTGALQCPMHVALAAGPADREALSTMAHAAFGLTPERLRNLRAAGMLPVVRQHPCGVERVLVQCCELDATHCSSHTAPLEARGDVASYELVPLAQALDMCRSGAVRDVDVWPLVAFAVRHGVVSPDTEPHYSRVCEALSYDLSRPFPY